MRVEHGYERKDALWLIWEPGMSIGLDSSVVASPRTASDPSALWSSE